MEENRYSCPDCGSTLKLKQAVPPGKKIKCPKCTTIFSPVKEAAAAKPAPAAAPDDDEIGTYGFTSEPKADEGAAKVETVQDVEKKMARRFPKSKKGPAQAIMQKPSNQLLATSSTLCASSIVSLIVALWPMLFGMKQLSDELFLFNLVAAGFCVIAFIYNAIITFGAVRLQNIESLAWGVIAGIMMILPSNWFLGGVALSWFLRLMASLAGQVFAFGAWGLISLWLVMVGTWSLLTLRNPEVLEGFYEKRRD